MILVAAVVVAVVVVAVGKVVGNGAAQRAEFSRRAGWKRAWMGFTGGRSVELSGCGCIRAQGFPQGISACVEEEV